MKTGAISMHERLRRYHGYSVTGFAKAIGVSHALVSQIEHGHLAPSARYRRLVAELLELPEEMVFTPPPR